MMKHMSKDFRENNNTESQKERITKFASSNTRIMLNYCLKIYNNEFLMDNLYII